MKSILYSIIILFFFSSNLFAHRETLWFLDSCNLNGLYTKDKTFLTFYGGSRVDETDMSFWLGPIIPDSNESVQTFGGYGMPSFMIRNHLEKCLTLNDYKIGTRMLVIDAMIARGIQQ